MTLGIDEQYLPANHLDIIESIVYPICCAWSARIRTLPKNSVVLFIGRDAGLLSSIAEKSNLLNPEQIIHCPFSRKYLDSIQNNPDKQNNLGVWVQKNLYSRNTYYADIGIQGTIPLKLEAIRKTIFPDIPDSKALFLLDNPEKVFCNIWSVSQLLTLQERAWTSRNACILELFLKKIFGEVNSIHIDSTGAITTDYDSVIIEKWQQHTVQTIQDRVITGIIKKPEVEKTDVINALLKIAIPSKEFAQIISKFSITQKFNNKQRLLAPLGDLSANISAEEAENNYSLCPWPSGRFILLEDYSKLEEWKKIRLTKLR